VAQFPTVYSESALDSLFKSIKVSSSFGMQYLKDVQILYNQYHKQDEQGLTHLEEELRKAESALNNIERKFINDEIGADTHNRQKSYYDTKLRELTVMVEEMGVLRKELVHYLSSAINLINNAD
jgi:hypothetical protein